MLVSVSMAIVVACSGGTSGSNQGTNVEGSSELDPAPDFLFVPYTGSGDLGASSLRLSDLAGTPVVLNFWAPLCPPCRAEMPDLQEFHEEFKDRVTLLGLDVGRYTGLGDRADALKLLDELDVTYPTASTSDGAAVRRYEIFVMPTTFFINAKGEIFRKWAGVLDKKALIQISEEMLAEQEGRTS
ncbi:MAG: TlpA family protein disulfide reductase [Chloroflexi bacterium]|nr:TlpA family protein disulfide reductase [Chloroflexota bacterium]